MKINIEFPTFTGGTNIVREINEYTIADFLDKLSKELWESTFNN